MFEEKYKEDYTQWKNKEQQAINSGVKNEYVIDNMEVQEKHQLNKVEYFQEGWNTYGPFAILFY